MSSAACGVIVATNWIRQWRASREGRGVVLYIRGHEGRGIGLLHKLAAYKLQDEGFDTVDANVNLGLPVDARDYGVGAQILYDLGVRSMRIMTNNPTKRAGIEGYGLSILEQVPLFIDANDENRDYLRAKATRLGHQMDLGQGGMTRTIEGDSTARVSTWGSRWPPGTDP